jgi:hypothetical protein
MDRLNKSFNLNELSFFKNLLVEFESTIVNNEEEINNKQSNDGSKKEDNKVISNKCSVCKKKVPLATRFHCGCDKDKMFCIQHRYPEEHACTKAVEKIKLDKVVADKLKGRI